jgi:RND family efflux transporter MFP subunit
VRSARAQATALRILPTLLLALLIPGCGDGGAQPSSAHRERPTSDHLVSAVVAELTPLSTAQERPGTLRFRKLVRIHSQEEGRVVELSLFEGDHVVQGQVLVRLEDDLLRAERDKAQATRDQKRLDLNRLDDLRRKRAASEDEVAQAGTLLALAEADLRLLETRLGFTRISAPFGGVITERLVEPGDFVTKNTHLLTLADPGSLVAEIYASELILPQVSVGDPARLRIDALGDQVFGARILRIHPRLEESSRQGIVELTLDPLPSGAKAGQFVRATLTTAAAPRLLIPLRALHRDHEGEFVWLVGADGKAARRAVTTGLRIADGVEILDGLTPGERVITRGFLGLAQGKTVKVVPG